MGQRKNTGSFKSYKQRREYDKKNNPRRADWSGLLTELQRNTIQNNKIKVDEEKQVNNEQETNN